MDRVLQPAGMPRGPAIRVAGRPPLRIRLPDAVAVADAPKAWFRLSRLSLAGSAVFHTAAVAALLQVPGIGDRAARTAGEILHVVYLGRVAEPAPPPPPPAPPVPEKPMPTEPEAVSPPEPPPFVSPAPVGVIPEAPTNAVPIETLPEPPPSLLPADPGPAPASMEDVPPTAVPTEMPEDPEPEAAAEDGPAWDAVRAAIHRHLAYPDAARRRGEEGRVFLRLVVGPEGRLEQAGVLANGAPDRLAAAALAAARRAAPFAPTSRGEFRIPIVFRLSPPAGH